MFFIDCIMNSRAFGLNLGKDKLLIRVFDDRIADLADDEVVARAFAAVFVRVDAKELEPIMFVEFVEGGAVTIEEETDVVSNGCCCCLRFLDFGDEPLLDELVQLLLVFSFFLLFFLVESFLIILVSFVLTSLLVSSS